MSYTLNYTGSEIDDILDRAAPGGAIDQALATKQDALTFDAVPTEGSTNPAESGGIYDAIQAGGAAALAAFATDTVSGDVVSFPDGADDIPVKSFTGSILPQQNLNGQSAPYPAGGGKNKFQTTASTTTNAGVTFTVNSDGSVKLARASSNANNASLQLGTITLAAGSYIVNGGGNPSTQGYMTLRNGSTDAWIANITASDYALTVSAETTYKLVAVVPSNLSPTNTLYPMIRLATEADATFAPYSNVCPISGWTGANITDAGGIDSDIEQGGIDSSGFNNNAGNRMRTASYYAVDDTKKYTFNITKIVADVALQIAVSFYTTNDYTTARVSGTGWESVPYTFTPPSGTKYIRVCIRKANNAEVNPSQTHNAMFGKTILLSFGQTVYAGTLTALGGGKWKIQPTMGVLNLASKTFARQSGSSIASPYFDTPMTGLNVADRASAVCNMYRYSTPTAGDTEESVFGFTSNGAYLRIRDNRYSTAADFMANAIPSCVILYPLATLPDPITITGEDLQTLLGANTVWTDVGSVTGMTYRADTALYIQKLLNGGGTLSTLSMASPSPSLSLGRVGALAEPEEAEPEQTDEEAEQLEQTEEPEQTEEA